MSLKIVLVLTSIIILLCSVYPAKADLVITTSGGNKDTIAWDPYIRVPSNKTYYSCILTLIIDFHARIYSNVNYSASYSIDVGENETVALESHYFGWQEMDKSYVAGEVTLPALSNGSHRITVYVEGYYWQDTDSGPYNHTSYDSQTVYFTVISPISLLMENETYNTTEIPLKFHINGTASQIAYSLDNQANITITGNTTLTGLTEGTHTLIVYANDTSGTLTNFDSTTFTMSKQSSSQGSSAPASPELLLLILLPSLALVAIAAILFFRKRKKQS